MLFGEKGLKMASFEKIIAVLSNNFDETFSFLMELADVFSNKGDFEKAFFIREELLNKNLGVENKIKVLLSLSSDFHKAGMYENAIRVLKEAVVISDDKDRILDLLSHLYIEMKDWENTILCQKMKKNKDNNFIVYSLCQWSAELLSLKDFKKAIFKIKEAEMIDKNNIHLKLHKADFLILEGKQEELKGLALELSDNFPAFFGIFLKKYFNCFSVDEDVKNLVERHLKKYENDFYTVHVYTTKLIEENRYSEAYDTLNAFLSHSTYNPYLYRSYIKCALQAGKSLNAQYISTFIQEDRVFEKWFRCENCGYESENFYFRCVRCNKLDALKQIHFDEQR